MSKYPHSSIVDRARMDSIRLQLSNTQDLGGACAEVGVYKGGTAELIAINRKERPLYLFDTFSGIPYSGKHDNHHKMGDFNDTRKSKMYKWLKKGGYKNSVYTYSAIPS